MIDPPSLNIGNAFCTVNSVPRVFRSKVASKCASVTSPSGKASPLPALANRTSNLALFPLDRFEQPVQVVEIGRVTAHAGHVPADHPHSLIELLLPPARDENVGTLFNEQAWHSPAPGRSIHP